MDLEKVRRKIDYLDIKILRLLNARMEQAIFAKKFKEEIEDIERETQLRENIRLNSRGLINPEFCAALYERILEESKRLQKMDNVIIAFQGEHGAYSEIAAGSWNPDLIPVACEEFDTIFEGVADEVFDFGIVPVENTLGGVVGEVNKLLINNHLNVIGAIELRVSHNLMKLPEASLYELKFVYSHPQALSQCRNFITRNNLEPVSYFDTAGAARMLGEKGLRTAAAIASKPAAEIYNLEIIKENVEDSPENRTRFLILSKSSSLIAGDKCSILFKMTHKTGILYQVLKIFADENINLTRIESFPDQPGTYAFFLDFIGSIKDDGVQSALENVNKITTNFRLLGCYHEIKT